MEEDSYVTMELKLARAWCPECVSVVQEACLLQIDLIWSIDLFSGVVTALRRQDSKALIVPCPTCLEFKTIMCD